MRPITRQAVVERRQPVLRWTAAIAGAAIAVALWVLLQVLGMGAGVAAIDLDDAGALRTLGLGTTAWTLFAPLVAMLAGGMFAARLAASSDRRVGAAHGLVVWAVTSLAGIAATLFVVTALAGGAMRTATTAVPLDTTHVQLDRAFRDAQVARATEQTRGVLRAAGVALLFGLLGACAGGALGVRRSAFASNEPAPPVG
jgi:hypothetical protein